jgi:glycosyltransferase involved in cell wall biosynthesis
MVSTEVIVTTYNNPAALNLVLAGLFYQSTGDFNICIADDGSGDATKSLVNDWTSEFTQSRLRHVWHPDTGFTKNKILNNAIASSNADYLIFIDGDCIASPLFVSRHLELRKKNYFVSGGVIRMPSKVTSTICRQIIQSGLIFTFDWLRNNSCITSVGSFLKSNTLPSNISSFLEFISPVKKTWNGGNSSGWRSDLLSVNGFNEDLTHGAEDIELGVRLKNIGIKFSSIRYSALLLHIDHSRPYANVEIAASNKRFVESVKKSKIYWTQNGIKKGL